MTQSIFDQIKEQISKFLPVIEALAIAYGEDFSNITGLNTIKVIVCNMAHNPKDCHGYSLETETADLYNYLAALKAISEYSSSHTELFIYNQIDMIITGNVMSEVEDTFHSIQEEFRRTQEYYGEYSPDA